MSASSTDRGLLTPENCGVIFIGYQPQIILAAEDSDREALLNSAKLLAKTAKVFEVPVLLVLVAPKRAGENLVPELSKLFPEHSPLRCSSMNAWDDPDFVASVKTTGRKNFVMATLWSEACMAFPALQMLEAGYGVYVVEDASRGTTPVAQEAALRRVAQAGGVALTALQVLLEFQRDWARAEHYQEVIALLQEHGGPGCQELECVAASFRREAVLPACPVQDSFRTV